MNSGLELECQALYPLGHFPSLSGPFTVVREQVFRSRAVTGPSKNNMCRDTLECSMWCAKPLLVELNQNLQLVGAESTTLPEPSSVEVSASILPVWGLLPCPRPPGVGESSQPQTGHQKEELSCRPCLPWGRHNLCAWFHRVSGVPHLGRDGLGSPDCRANRGVTD